MDLESTYAMINENAYNLMYNNEIPPSLFYDCDGFEEEELEESQISVPEGFFDSSDAKYEVISIEICWNVIHFLALRDFFKKATDEDKCIMVYING